MARVGGDDVPTLLAIGAIVPVIASLAHEMLGHGTGCLVDGGSISLMTFLVFRCVGAGVAADGGGPIGALVVAVGAFALFYLSGERRPTLRLFLLTLGVVTLLWVCAQMVSEAIDGSDDWGHVARDLAWPSTWRIMVCAIGVTGYLMTANLAATLARPFAQGRPMRLLLPYLATAVTAVPLGGLCHGDPVASALDAFMTFGLAPLGYLFVVRAAGRNGANAGSLTIQRNPAWLMVALLVVAVFAATIARGVGRLA